MQNIMECLELSAGVILAWVKFHPVGDTDALPCVHCYILSDAMPYCPVKCVQCYIFTDAVLQCTDNIVTFLQMQCFTVVYVVTFLH